MPLPSFPVPPPRVLSPPQLPKDSLAVSSATTAAASSATAPTGALPATKALNASLPNSPYGTLLSASTPITPTTTRSNLTPGSALPLPVSASPSASSSRYGTLTLTAQSLPGQSDHQLLAQLGELATLSHNPKAARKLARNRDTIATLLEAVRSKPTFVRMVEYSLACLRNLAVDGSSVEEMVEEDVVGVVMTVLKLNPYNERIQSVANALLSTFCVNDALAASVGAKIGAAPTIHSMRKHVEAGTVASTCQTAGRLMRSDDNLHMLVKGGVLPALHHVYGTQEESPAVMEAANECVALIAQQSYHTQQLLESRVAEDVLASLKHYPENEKIVTAGLATFHAMLTAQPTLATAPSTALSPRHATTAQATKDAIACLPAAVDTLMTAIEAHPDNDALLDQGAAVLRALSDGNEMGLLLAVDVGNNSATASAVGKVSSLLLVESNVEALVKAGGVGWVMRAINAAATAAADGDANVHTAAILTSGARALQRLCVDEQKIYSLMQNGAVKALVNILDKHRQEADVAVAAVKALTAMTTREENGLYIAKSGGVRLAEAVRAAHPLSDKVAARVMELQSKLAAFPRVAPLQVKDGVVQGIVDLFNRRSQPEASDDIAKRALLNAVSALSRLARHGADCAAAVVAGEVMGGLSGVLKVNRGQEEIVTRGLEFFAQCAELSHRSLQQSAAMKDKDKGVMDSVLVVMDAMKDNAAIQGLCSQLIPMLSNTEKGKESTAVTSALQQTTEAINSHADNQMASLLTNVQHVSQLSLMDANTSALVEQGAVRRLVEAFDAAARAHADSAAAGVRVGVMSGAAHAVHRLMKERQVDVCGTMMKGGMANTLVLSAVAEHSESVSSSVTPLIAVLAADASNAADLIKDGTVQGMLTLAKQHHLNEQIVHDTTKTIGLVVQQSTGYISKIVEWGSAEVLIDSLLTHHADLHRTQETLQVIHTVTAQQASVPSFLSMDSISAIVEIMRVYAQQPDILTLSMQCLAHFLVNQDAAQEVGQLNGCALLVKAMRDHYIQEELCEIDMILLSSLSSLPSNVELLLDAELATVELVKWVANKYSKNQVLVEAGQKLLTALDVHKEEPLDLLNSFDGTQADLILSRLRNPNLSPQDLLSLLSSLASLVNSSDKADILAAKGGLALLAGHVNRNVKNEALFYGSAAALLRVCDWLGEGSVGELGRGEVLQALAAVVNSGQLGFGVTVSAGDLTSAVRAMGRLKMKDDVVKQILLHDPLKTLMSVIYNSNDQDLLPAAARLVSKLTNHDEAASHISRITNLRELIQAMRKQAQERGALAEDFLKYGVYLLGNLAANDERVKDEIGIEGGIQVILFIVNIPLLKAKAAFVEYCTLALANLSLNSSNNQAFIVASRGIGLLLELITQHNRATELLDNAVCVLCNVCYRNDSNKDAILQLNGAKILVATALANFSAVPVLLSCFRTLGNLAYSPHSTSAIIAAGAVQALVAGMSIHGGHGELCLLCLRVMTNLSSDYVEANMATMREEGAVQAVIEVCRSHADSKQAADMELVNAGLLCLCNLGRFYPNAQLIILQSITTDLVTIIHTHHSDAILLLSAARLFNILAHTHPADLDRMLDGGVAAGVKEALECSTAGGAVKGAGAGGGVRAVFSHLCAGLTLLCYNHETAAEVGVAGVVVALLAVLNAHASDTSYFVDAFPALSALCRDESNASQMSQPAFAYASTALSSPQLDHKLLLHSFAFLSNLCVHASAAQCIVQTRVLALTFTALHAHANLPEVLLRGLRSVENLCYTGDAVKAYLAANQLEREVLRVMSDNMRHEDVKRACQAILDAYHTHQSTFELPPLSQPAEPFKDIEIKSARQLFGDEHKEPSDLFPDHIRNFLISGQLLTKHSKTAPPRPRHVYVTADLKWLVWKDPRRPLHPDNKMKAWKLRGVERGRCSQQLLRKRFGKFLCREEGGFAIVGRDRNVDLECESEKDREKWVEAIQAFVAWLKWTKKNASQFDKEEA